MLQFRICSLKIPFNCNHGFKKKIPLLNNFVKRKKTHKRIAHLETKLVVDRHRIQNTPALLCLGLTYTNIYVFENTILK